MGIYRACVDSERVVSDNDVNSTNTTEVDFDTGCITTYLVPVSICRFSDPLNPRIIIDDTDCAAPGILAASPSFGRLAIVMTTV